MSKKELLVSIKIDSETGKVVALNGAFKQIESTVKQATSTTDKFLKRLTDMAHVVTGIYIVDKALETVKKTLEETVVAGVKLNKTIEDARAGIAALIAANTKGVTDIHKFNVALSMSSDILQKIKKASVDTAATFPQLTEIFNQAIGGALSAGKSFGKNTEEVINNTIKLAQRMSNIANAIGMPMEQVNEEIRSIIEGTITADSRIGKMLHITNEEIKKAKESVGGLAKFLEEKLAPFDVLTNVDTLSRNFARLSDTIDSIRIEATKPIFNDLTNEIKDLSKWLKEHKSDIVYYAKFTYYGLKKLAITINALFISPVRIAFNVVEIIIKKFLAFFVSKLAFLEELLNGLADKFNSLANKIGIDFKIEKSHKFSEWYKKLQDSAKNDIDDIKNAFKEIRNLSKDLTAVDIQFTESVVKATKHIEKQTLALKEQVINKDKLAKIEKQRINIINEINSLLGQTDKFEAIQLKYNQEKEKILKAYKDGIITISQKEELLAKLQEWKNQKELDYVKSLKNVDDYTTRILKNKQAEVDITNKLIKQSKELVKTISDLEDDPYKKLKTRYEDYLKKIQTDTVLNEKQKAELKLKTDKWYNKELQKLNKQTLEKLQHEYKKYLNENYKLFLSTLDDVNNTLETDFFDALKGKFHSFSDFLKSLFKDVGNSIYNSLAKSISGSIADYLTGSVKKAVVPSFTSFVGVDNFAQKLGLKLQNGQYVGEVNGQQVVLDTSGNIVQGADAVKQSFGINDVSNVRSIYDLTTKYFPQVTAALSDVSAGFQTWMSGQALITPSATANTVNAALMGSEYGQGLATSGWSQAGYYGGGALAGAGIGYSMGSLGDKLFGADTKAAQYGAIGGTIGGVVGGPVGAVIGGAIGSAIGGMFGKWKTTFSGFLVKELTALGEELSDIVNLEIRKEKSWFHTKTSSSTSDLTYLQKAFVHDIFKTYETFFDSFYPEAKKQANILLGKGQYTTEQLKERIIKNFLHKFIYKSKELTNSITDFMLRSVIAGVETNKIYAAWKEYAKSVKKEVDEAIREAFTEVIQFKNQYSVWYAETFEETLAGLKKQKEFLEEQLESLKEDLHITNVTAENYLEKMQEAIKRSPDPITIKKWEQLGEALKAATEAAEKLRIATLNQYSENSKLKEYLLQLNSTIANNIVSSVNTLIDTFEDLSNTIQTTMDNWYNGGYTPEESFEYYIQRYNEEKNTLLSYIDENGVINPNADIKDVKKHLDFLLNLSGNLKNAASAYLSPDTRELFLNSVFNDLDYFKDVFSNTKDVLKVVITKDETDIAKNETLAGLKDAIENYNQLILKQFGDDKLTLSDFFTDKSLMNPEDIRKFANILQPKNLQELDKWVNILGNVKWQGADYLNSLNSEDLEKAIDLLKELGANVTTKTFNGDFLDWYYKNISVNDLEGVVPYGTDIKSIRENYQKFLEDINTTYTAGLEVAISDIRIQEALDNKNYMIDDMLEAFEQKITEQSDSLTEEKLNDLIKNFTFDYNGETYQFNDDIKDIFDIFSAVKGAATAAEFALVPTYINANYSKEGLQPLKDLELYDIELPAFANGGIVTSPTIGLIGEAGYSEAVIPLPNGHLNMRIQKDDDRLINEIMELHNTISQMNEKIARLERVISRNEGENGLMVEMVS